MKTVEEITEVGVSLGGHTALWVSAVDAQGFGTVTFFGKTFRVQGIAPALVPHPSHDGMPGLVQVYEDAQRNMGIVTVDDEGKVVPQFRATRVMRRVVVTREIGDEIEIDSTGKPVTS